MFKREPMTILFPDRAPAVALPYEQAKFSELITSLNEEKTMPSRKPVVVNLPNLKPAVELPRRLAETLEKVISAGSNSISSLRLIEEGIISIHNNITELRKRGAIIHSKRKPADDWRGETRPGIAHYTYMGWI